jgi:hemerythrin superfamily protein
MKTKSKTVSTSESERPEATEGIISLLVKDHRAMKELMANLKEDKTNTKRFATFRKLEKLIHSHMLAEEKAFLEKIKDNPKFEDEAVEGLEEHEIHRVVIKSIHRVKDPDRRYVRMKSFCEILTHHLREEEEELFPEYKRNSAKVTRRRVGRSFLKTRKKTNTNNEDLGALEPTDGVLA